MRLALAAVVMCAGGCDIILRLDHREQPGDAQVTNGDTGNGPIVFVQGKSGTSVMANVMVVGWSAPQQAGDLNVIIIGWTSSTSSITSVTDSAGNAYQAAASALVANGLGQMMYFAPNITGGTNTVDVMFDEAASNVDVRMLEYSGIATTNALDSTVSASDVGSMMTTGELTTTHPHTLVVAGFMSTGTTTEGAGYTKRVLSTNGNLAEDREMFVAQPVDATATQSQLGAFVGHAAAFVSN